MLTGQGQIIEVSLENGKRLVRISCPPNLIPAPGQYVLVGKDVHDSDSLLPVPVFYTDSATDGFMAVPLTAQSWKPGQTLHLRGPFGVGFELPASARKLALVAWDDSPARLRGLIGPALRRDAAVVLVCDHPSDRLPDEVEVQPLSALADVLSWADYVALDVVRENLPQLRERLGGLYAFPAVPEAQILIGTPMPCGGIAECAVCTVGLKSGWKLVCKDGPVLRWRDLVWNS